MNMLKGSQTSMPTFVSVKSILIIISFHGNVFRINFVLHHVVRHTPPDLHATCVSLALKIKHFSLES